MKKFLAGSVLALMTLSSNALAVDYIGWIEKNFSPASPISLEDIPSMTTQTQPALSPTARIAVARLDGGRLIPTPFFETEDWTYLDRRVSAEIKQLGAGTYIHYIPEIPFHGQDTMNKIDEIRLAAANEGFDHVLIYGVGPDASWASFGKRALSETGLTVREDCKSWEAAKAKALLVNSYTGEVIGAATANEVDYNIGQLADGIFDLITDLSS